MQMALAEVRSDTEPIAPTETWGELFAHRGQIGTWHDWLWGIPESVQIRLRDEPVTLPTTKLLIASLQLHEFWLTGLAMDVTGHRLRRILREWRGRLRDLAYERFGAELPEEMDFTEASERCKLAYLR